METPSLLVSRTPTESRLCRRSTRIEIDTSARQARRRRDSSFVFPNSASCTARVLIRKHASGSGVPEVKRITTLYWIVTGLMAAFMLLASVPDILQAAQAVSIFGHLGYPRYLLPFLGTAKSLGVLTILVVGIPRLKEW